jgi:hypothetical protein
LRLSRITIDSAAPDDVYDPRQAKLQNSFEFELVKAGHDGCAVSQPVLNTIQGPHGLPQDTSQSHSELLPIITFIAIHVKYHQAGERRSKFTEDPSGLEIRRGQAGRNIPPDRGSPAFRSGVYFHRYGTW